MTYPEGLPVPQTSTVTQAERRAVSDPNRPREARSIQRDRLDYERLTWPSMSVTDVEMLLDWWRDELVYGGAWFLATWPSLQGLVMASRKFSEQPNLQFVPGGYWRISALCEVRGRTVLTEPVEVPPSFILREDGFYILREDGGRYQRQ